MNPMPTSVRSIIQKYAINSGFPELDEIGKRVLAYDDATTELKALAKNLPEDSEEHRILDTMRHDQYQAVVEYARSMPAYQKPEAVEARRIFDEALERERLFDAPLKAIFAAQAAGQKVDEAKTNVEMFEEISCYLKAFLNDVKGPENSMGLVNVALRTEDPSNIDKALQCQSFWNLPSSEIEYTLRNEFGFSEEAKLDFKPPSP